jgi:hypothetical protein
VDTGSRKENASKQKRSPILINQNRQALNRNGKSAGFRLVMLRPSPRRTFYVAVFRNQQDAWCWEIRRKRRPMGVRLWESGFRSYNAAELAGKQALEDFLNGLSMDTGSKSLFSESGFTKPGTEIAGARHRASRKKVLP